MSEDEPNPLISTVRASADTSPEIQLHPLVLLTISDYTTRHTLRNQEGPIVGAILGQQNGRVVTMEVAFECKVQQTETGDVELDETWFGERLEQFKDVYKVPALELVGWFALGSPIGPQPHHLPIQQFLMNTYNEAVALLLFHPGNVYDRATSAGKLPLALYESQWETSSGTQDAAAMDVDGQTNQGKSLKFKELSYIIETGEAEMISVDFVARGGGNATAIDSSKSTKTEAQPPAETKKGKGKGKGKGKAAEAEDESPASDTLVLSAEDEEILSSITAKTNAIRMLHARIELLHTYLSSLPSSYLNDASIPPSQSIETGPDQVPIDQPILRHLLSLLSRLPILAPPSTAQFLAEAEETRSDTALIELLSSITGSVSHTKELGRKVAVVDNIKQVAHMRKGGLTSFGDAESMGKMGGAMDSSFLQSVMSSGEGRQLRERKFWS